ncbi:MAG: DUF222 domain-containing protein [Acidimicrobiales bacterium]
MQFAEIGRRWSVALVGLVQLAVRLDDSGEWALDGSPTCAHWIAATLDVEVCTAREWIRIGRALNGLPRTSAAFASGAISYTKARAITRLGTVDNEADLLAIAERTPAGHLGTALAAWSARHEDEQTRHDRHRRERGLRWRTQPDGMVTASLRLMPEQAAVLQATVDAEVMRGGRTEPVEAARSGTEGGNGAPRSRRSHRRWSSLAQQRVDALVRVVSGGGSAVATEVILHVRADGCTLDDGTPIAGSAVEHLMPTAALRAMIHDAEGRPINVSGKHRHHTTRQKRVVKERDRVCVDCGGTDFPQYDHVPDFDISRRTLVEETELRCSRCHTARHRRENGT